MEAQSFPNRSARYWEMENRIPYRVWQMIGGTPASWRPATFASPPNM